MLDILYIHPSKGFDNPKYSFIPIGIIPVLNKLIENGYKVRAINYGLEKSKNESFDIKKVISQLNFKILLVDLHWYEHTKSSLDLAKVCKKLKPNLKILVKELNKKKKLNHGYLSTPFSIHLYPTMKCNQFCTFCYAYSNNKKKINKDMEYKDLENILNKAIKNKIIILNLIGGEPLIRFNDVYRILKKASKYMFCGLSTNGSYNNGITEKQAKLLAKIKNIEVRVSLLGVHAKTHDNLTQLKGSYKVALNSLKKLIKYGVRTSVNMTITKENYKEVIPLMQKARKLGAFGFGLLPLLIQGRATYKQALNPKEYNKIIKKLNKYSRKYKNKFLITYVDRFNITDQPSKLDIKNAKTCSAGDLLIEVLPDGSTYPCSMTLNMNKFYLGNLKRDSIKKIWNNKKLDFFRERKLSDLKNPKCIACNKKEECMGGCPIASYLLNGNPNMGDPNCAKIGFPNR